MWRVETPDRAANALARAGCAGTPRARTGHMRWTDIVDTVRARYSSVIRRGDDELRLVLTYGDARVACFVRRGDSDDAPLVLAAELMSTATAPSLVHRARAVLPPGCMAVVGRAHAVVTRIPAEPAIVMRALARASELVALARRAALTVIDDDAFSHAM